MDLKFIYEFILKNKFAVLSTISKDSKPQSACIGIAVTHQLKLIFDTTKESRKYSNLKNDPSVSLVIGWEEGQTIQYEGISHEIDIAEDEDILKVYFDAFPEGIDRYKNWKNITYFLVEPLWIRFSDFNQIVPNIVEIKF